MIYVSYSRGLKSGVYNTPAVLTDASTGVVSDPVDPEILDAYKIGLKAVFSDRVRLNASAFYYDYTDLQVPITVPGATAPVNVAEAEIFGAEIDIAALATDQLELGLAVSWLDTEYSSFPLGPIATPLPTGGNAPSNAYLTGNELAQSPEFTVNVSATYNLPTDSGNYSANLSYMYNDGFSWQSDNRLQQDSYDLLNGELSWLSVDETWRLRLYGRNLLDQEYMAQGIAEAFGDHFAAAPPRTIGVALKYSFF